MKTVGATGLGGLWAL